MQSFHLLWRKKLQCFFFKNIFPFIEGPLYTCFKPNLKMTLCHILLVQSGWCVCVCVCAQEIPTFQRALYFCLSHHLWVNSRTDQAIPLTPPHHDITLLGQISQTLLPFVPIIHHFQQVFQTTSCIRTELLQISSCWLSNTCTSV